MVRPTLAARDPDLTGCGLLVIGLGKSGLAAARLAAGRGARVTIADARPPDELGAALERGRSLGATIHAGGHPPALLAGTDLVVLSPGVPPGVEIVAAARSRGIPVWGEIELGARFCRGRVVAITGSNGKSTTTSMVGAILRGAGVPGGTGGNLDTPFCDLLAHDAPAAVHALELSSFQLETVETLRPAVAAILNLAPDHLDRYPSYDAYAAAKARLLELQSRDDAAILNADDPASRRFDTSVRGRAHTFSTRTEVERGAFVRRGRLVVRTAAAELEPLEIAALALPGEHNLANALAAALAAALVGIPAEAIARGLAAFRPLPHRLELVATVGGVRYFNDSKATNPASAARALDSFAPGSVHLILGGKDKGADWSPLLELLERQARQVLLVGRAAELLAGLVAGLAPVVECGTVARAVAAAHAAARPGDVVLLAPGCASFDQYRNFEERGEDFRRVVRALGDGEDGRA